MDNCTRESPALDAIDKISRGCAVKTLVQIDRENDYPGLYVQETVPGLFL